MTYLAGELHTPGLTGVRYRWAVLAAGTLSQTSFSALAIGLPVLVPTLREEYDLSLGQIGVVLGAEWMGALVTMLPWGIAADRFGERVVLALGLGACAAFLVGAAYAPDFGSLVALLALAGAAGASVNSASGRAVMHWFTADERGLALGVRQTAVPLGGLIAALALPPLISDGDATAGFLFFAVLCVVGAVVGAAVIRGRAEVAPRARDRDVDAAAHAARRPPLAPLRRRRHLRVLPDRRDRVRRRVPARRARAQRARRGARDRGVAGAGRRLPHRDGPVVRHRGLADPAAPAGGRRHRRRAGRDRRAGRRAALAARAGAGTRGRALDGLERARVRRRRGARRRGAERRGDRLPAVGAERRRDRRAHRLRRVGRRARPGRSRSCSPRSCRSRGGSCCVRCAPTRLRACGSSSASTSCTRSAVDPAQTVHIRRRPRTRRTVSPPSGSRTPASRRRSTGTAT